MNNPIDKVTDPAERKQAETALQEREQLLRQLAETIQEVFWMISPDWKQVFYVSPAYEMLWGRTCESLYVNPLSWLEAVLPEDRQALQALVQQQIRDDSVSAEALLYRIRRPDGAIRWIRAR
ncbi:MAG: PAS domain-containing protein, partial [Sedimentisphaerales bacterium]|nr:PAS domain-containing protein [Sedimentisphaerales bacterium]